MPKNTKQSPAYYDVSAIAEMLDVTPRAIQKWCDQGRFVGAFKLGDGGTSPWRIPVDAFERFVRERKESAQAGVA